MKTNKSGRKSASSQSTGERKDGSEASGGAQRCDDSGRLKMLEEKLENVLRLLSPRQKLQDSAATTEDRLKRLEGTINTLSKRVEREEPRRGQEKHTESNERRTHEKRTYHPFDYRDEVEEKEFTKYFSITVTPEKKRKINPYALKSAIKETTGGTPESVTTSGREAFTVKVRTPDQSEKIVRMKSIGDVECTVERHRYYNQRKGLIFIYEFDISDAEEVRKGLQAEYNISAVEQVTFIKPRNPQTKVFLLTFEQERLPEYVYIPGEGADTKVIPFQPRPKLCKQCWKYGHVKARCNQTPACGRCGETHDILNCSKDEKCLHCKGAHRTGFKECPVQVREQTVIEYQETHRVGRRMAVQMLEGKSSVTTRSRTQGEKTNFFKCTMDENHKRQMTPWALESTLRQHIGEKPKSIRAIGRDTFLIEVHNERQGEEVLSIREINKIPVEISEYNNNKQKGLVYIYEYDLEEFDEFRKGLMKEHNLHEVIRASWIKPRSAFTKALLITFKDGNIPEYIEIPGEQSKTKVYEYYSKPQICNKCLQFRHGVKYCRSTEQVCGKCDGVGHDKSNCNSAVIKCHHCSEQHYTGDKNCSVYKYEQEILIIQAKQKISRRQAVQFLDKNNPAIKLDYLRAATRPRTSEWNEESGRAPGVGDRRVVQTGVQPTIRVEAIIETSHAMIRQQREENSSKRTREEPEEEEVPHKKTKDHGKTSSIKEAVCISPQSGRIFTAPVQMETEDSELDQDEMTSENNPVLRKEVYKEYCRQTREINKTNATPSFKKPSSSGRQYRSRSRSPSRKRSKSRGNDKDKKDRDKNRRKS